MADRPIIFSAPMVRALLEGRKTQTRRVLSHKSIDLGIAPRVEVCHPEWIQFLHPQGGPLTCVKWPYAPGDRLWVREAFIGPYAYEVNEYPPHDWGNKPIWFPADGPVPEKHAGQFWHRARPSIHMPRWASRLTLTVTEVRVQRLADISEADAVAEGALQSWTGSDPESDTRTALNEFEALWNSLHGPGAWDANPWVVALTFTVQRGNIDQLPGVAG